MATKRHEETRKVFVSSCAFSWPQWQANESSMSAQWGTHDLSRLAGRIQQLFFAGQRAQPCREANSVVPSSSRNTSMKTRCVSSGTSVVPFFYPSVSRSMGIAPLGVSKWGEVALSNNEPLAAPVFLERASPPDTDDSLHVAWSSREPLPSSPSRRPAPRSRSMRR